MVDTGAVPVPGIVLVALPGMENGAVGPEWVELVTLPG